MSLRDFKIGTRLGIGFGSILAILVVVIVSANALNYRNKAQLLTGLALASEKNTQASLMKSAMLETGIAMRNIGLQGDVGLMQAEEGKVRAQRKLYDGARGKLAGLGLSDGEKALLANIAKVDGEVDAAFKEAMGQVLAFNSEGAAKVIATRIDPVEQDDPGRYQQAARLAARGAAKLHGRLAGGRCAPDDGTVHPGRRGGGDRRLVRHLHHALDHGATVRRPGRGAEGGGRRTDVARGGRRQG